jgi:prolyl-tRNA synthetase
MTQWHKINYLGKDFRPFHIRLDYSHEDISLKDIYSYDDDQEWIDKTQQEIADGYKYFVILRAKVYLAGVELSSHSLGGLLFDDTDQMEGMMATDYEGIISEAVANAKHNLEKMSEAMAGVTA